MCSTLENVVIGIIVDMAHHDIHTNGNTLMDIVIVTIHIIQIATMMGIVEMSKEVDIMIINGITFVCLFVCLCYHTLMWING